MRIFENEEFGKVRTVEIEGQPYFVGKDIATALGYSNPQKAIRDHVDDEDRTVNDSFTVNGTEIVLINESGLYSLVLSSKLPSAKKFKRWVTREVLPSIRKTGGYIGNTEEMSDEDILAKALLIAQRTIEQKSEQIRTLEADAERMRPKEIFADAVTGSSDTIPVGELAKILRQNGYRIGRNRLFDWLRENGYLIQRAGDSYNCPTQKAMDMGLFEIKETVVTRSDGSVSLYRTSKVTGKGQIYFIHKFSKGVWCA